MDWHVVPVCIFFFYLLNAKGFREGSTRVLKISQIVPLGRLRRKLLEVNYKTPEILRWSKLDHFNQCGSSLDAKGGNPIMNAEIGLVCLLSTLF